MPKSGCQRERDERIESVKCTGRLRDRLWVGGETVADSERGGERIKRRVRDSLRVEHSAPVPGKRKKKKRGGFGTPERKGSILVGSQKGLREKKKEIVRKLKKSKRDRHGVQKPDFTETTAIGRVGADGDGAKKKTRAKDPAATEKRKWKRS